jgi:hypothetical protein
VPWQLGRHGVALDIAGVATALGLPFGRELASASLSMLYLLGGGYRLAVDDETWRPAVPTFTNWP